MKQETLEEAAKKYDGENAASDGHVCTPKPVNNG